MHTKMFCQAEAYLMEVGKENSFISLTLYWIGISPRPPPWQLERVRAKSQDIEFVMWKERMSCYFFQARNIRVYIICGGGCITLHICM
jgi:hypothetical protein